MNVLAIVLDGTAILGCVASILLLCHLRTRVDRLAKLVAEVEVQETLDRLLLEMPNIEPADLEQRARVEVRPLAARILREDRGLEYDAWLAERALGKAGKSR